MVVSKRSYAVAFKPRESLNVSTAEGQYMMITVMIARDLNHAVSPPVI